MSLRAQGPVPRKMVKFNLGLSQILSKVFLYKNMFLELTKYMLCLYFQKKEMIAQNVPLGNA